MIYRSGVIFKAMGEVTDQHLFQFEKQMLFCRRLQSVLCPITENHQLMYVKR